MGQGSSLRNSLPFLWSGPTAEPVLTCSLTPESDPADKDKPEETLTLVFLPDSPQSSSLQNIQLNSYIAGVRAFFGFCWDPRAIFDSLFSFIGKRVSN